MSRRDPDELTIAPDGRPMEEQPKWRRDFPVDVPQDQYVARREFTKFLALTSFAFVAGQAWILAKSYLGKAGLITLTKRAHPCHSGNFDLVTGRPISGPPRRPLPKVELEIRGDQVFAVGITERTA